MTISQHEGSASAPTNVHFVGGNLCVDLADGRTISTPLDWYPSLALASAQDRDVWELTEFGVHWPRLDEDLSVFGMLAGRRATGRRQAREARRLVPNSISLADYRAQRKRLAISNILVDTAAYLSTDVLERISNER